MAPSEQTVPRKGISEPSYAVHRPSEAGASSPSPQIQNHEDEEDHRSSTPPPYSGPTSSSMSLPTAPVQQPSYPGLPRLNYSLYSPSGFTLSSDQTTITSYEPRLSTYPTALISRIQQLATVPPKPQVRIIGKSSDGSIDFDVKVNMMNLIVPEEERKGRMNYVKVIGNGEMGYRGDSKESTLPTRTGGLEEWVRTYCEDVSGIKHFVLERTVINWDTSYLEGRLLSLISGTSYRGHVTVSFPLTHNRVVVHSPDKVNRFFSNIAKVFTGTKKYEIIKSVWPYADVPRGESGRRCAVQEEEVWFRNWSDSIRHAVMGRRKGWVTIEDRLEFLMEPKVVEGQKPADWGSF